MQMEVFEYGVYAKSNVVAGFNDLDRAKAYAFKVAKREHCDVDIINSFTGEVHQSLCCQIHITYSADMEEIEKFYEVKEREW